MKYIKIKMNGRDTKVINVSPQLYTLLYIKEAIMHHTKLKYVFILTFMRIIHF